jgi:anti-sigma B factor antagonist
MALSLDTRGVGEVTIVRCSGRIVAGETAESLRRHIATLLLDRRDIVLHLGAVDFIDSSGLGTLVRLLTSIRRARGDLKLCHVPQNLDKVLKLTKLISLFDTLSSEEDAVSAFYKRTGSPGRSPVAGPSVMCVDTSADVLAYLRELLRGAGYNVMTSSNLHDSLILIRATSPSLIVIGPNLSASPGTEQAFAGACAALPVLKLGSEFSTLEAGRAGSEVLEQIRASLPSRSGMAS